MNKISETAFLVNWARNFDTSLSKDKWAHLWVTNETARFGKKFKKQVSPWEEKLVCLRNRYFVDCLEAFEKHHQPFVFLNIAAGFTHYPQLLNPKNIFIETDYPHVIGYKKENLDQFEKAGEIPERNIHFVALDLNESSSLKQLEEIIVSRTNNHLFFVLLEGILYYLKEKATRQIFELLEKCLPLGSQVGTISWGNQIKKRKIMENCLDFLEKDLGFSKEAYTWIDDEWFEQWRTLKIVERTNYLELEKKYCPPPHNFTRESIIDESFHLLEKV